MAIAALVLAAGAARRFGSDKRLHPIDGQPMLAHTLALYREVLGDVAAVVRPDEPAVAAVAVAANCRVIEAADAALGMSRSLAAGVAAMRHTRGLLIGLADMPFVRPNTLRTLVAAMQSHPQRIVRPTHNRRPGNPVGFPPSHFDALTRLKGDAGARDILVGRTDVLAVPVDDVGVLRDVDQPSEI